MHKDRDAALVKRCMQGDRRAMSELVSLYNRPVFNAAYRIVGNLDDAADITQIVFLKVFEHLQEFDSRFKFFSWIYRIAVNESINQLNRRKRLEELGDREAASGPGPDATFDRDQVSEELQEALMTLSQDHRAVIVLRQFTEISYREIGEILQIPEKTVKSRLFSARKAMKAQLERRGIAP